MKVFWSWQSDRPVKVTRNFIQDSLDQALTRVASDLALSPAERPELDHDTKGEAGLVEIVNTILTKIDGAAAFVADVTPIAETGQGKKIPNPNVMIELGHAMKSLGHQAIILVANTAYGGRPEDLPFDLRHRRGAITYHLRTEDGEEAFRKAKERLVDDLTSALSLNLEAALRVRDGAIEFVRHPAQADDPSTWLAPGEQVEHGNYFGEAGEHSLNVQGTTRSFLRIAPAGWAVKRPTRHQVHNAPQEVHLRPLGRAVSGDGGTNKLGAVSVGLWRGTAGVTHTASQWFDKTGEVWGFDGDVASMENGRVYLGHYRVLKDWSTMLNRTLEFYKHFGAKGPFNVEVGVGGLEDVYWTGQYTSEQTRSLEPYVSHAHTSRDWNPATQLVFLTEAYNQLREAFGRAHLSETEVKSILISTPR